MTAADDAPLAPQPALASWRRRAVAVTVDAVVLAFVVLVTLLLAGVRAEQIDRTIREGEPIVMLLLFIAPRAVYDTVFIGSRSQTPGKRWLGIKVVDAGDASPIGYSRAFGRWVSTAAFWALFTVPGIVDHLWPLRDRRNQTLHDKVVRSLVVRA